MQIIHNISFKHHVQKESFHLQRYNLVGSTPIPLRLEPTSCQRSWKMLWLICNPLEVCLEYPLLRSIISLWLAVWYLRHLKGYTACLFTLWHVSVLQSQESQCKWLFNMSTKFRRGNEISWWTQRDLLLYSSWLFVLLEVQCVSNVCLRKRNHSLGKGSCAEVWTQEWYRLHHSECSHGNQSK